MNYFKYKNKIKFRLTRLTQYVRDSMRCIIYFVQRSRSDKTL